MALLNFKADSEDKLRGILGSYVTEEDRPRLRVTDSYVEKFYYKVTQIIQGTIEGTEDTYTEYKAIQVNPDGTEVENGIVFDSDQEYKDDANSPLYLPNLQINEELFSGSVELGKAYQVEEVDPEDISTGAEPVYYIIPKGGGGTSTTLYGKITDNTGSFYVADIYKVSNPDISDTPIKTGVNIYKNSNYGIFSVGFVHEVVLATDAFTPSRYNFLDLPIYGTCVISSGSGQDYSGTVTISNDVLTETLDVDIKAPSLQYGDLIAGYSMTGVFGSQWEISPALFGG